MTISGTLWSSFLITLGLLLGAVGLGGDVASPFRDARNSDHTKAGLQRKQEPQRKSEPQRTGELQINGARARTRFVAAQSAGGGILKTRAVAENPAAQSPAPKPTSTSAAVAPKPVKKPPAKKAPPQQAGWQWPWGFLGQ